jgi:hypothetical protein
MSSPQVILDRLIRVLRSCESAAARFPATEVFNETWMLRLVLDAIQVLELPHHPLMFLAESTWYSEALLASPFRPRTKLDPLGEGFTNADGVVGHFDLRASTRSGLCLTADARQFVVVEAKMFSNLSTRTQNAIGYNQAARNVACMAEAIAKGGRPLDDLESVGFFVLAPALDRRQHRDMNLEKCLDPDSVRSAVRRRIAKYETEARPEVSELNAWEANSFLPLVDRLTDSRCIRVLSWEECIESIRGADLQIGDELGRFYERCLAYSPTRATSNGGPSN